jgi:hypothetical protein
LLPPFNFIKVFIFLDLQFDPEGTPGFSGLDVSTFLSNRGIGRKTLLVRIPAVFESLAGE